MNRTIAMLAGLMALAFAAGPGWTGVTWQMDSNPFTFTATAVKNARMFDEAQPRLWNGTGVQNGVAIIRYRLPAAIKHAQLRIYNTRGLLVRSFAAEAGTHAVSWNIVKEKAVAGFYLATLDYGSASKTIPVTIIK